MALTAAAAAAAAEWSAQFLWIWFAEMRFVASHHVSLVKLAEHVTLKAAAATPRKAKFPSPAICTEAAEKITVRLRQESGSRSFTKPFVEFSAAHVGAMFVRFARGGTQAWLLQRGAPRGFFVSAWLGSAVHPILCPMAHRSVCAATRAGGKEARNLAIIIMGRGRHEHVDPHTREAFQATPCSLVQQFWHMHAGPQQAISRKWKVPRSFCQPRD